MRTNYSLIVAAIVAVIAIVTPPNVEAGCSVPKAACYVDGATRILGKDTNPVSDGVMTKEWCAQLCTNQGKKLAGVEYASQCFCGDALNYQAKTSSACTLKCTGSNAETCGGSYAIEVFPVNCSGPPVPEPARPACPFNQENCTGLYNPCLDTTQPFHAMPFCNPELSLEERARDMVSRMAQKEKLAMLNTNGPAVPELGLKGYNWWHEASSGVSTGFRDTTKFAFPITTGMSFNRTLWYYTGQRIGVEARALMNAGDAGSTFWAPVINLAREPRWGRNIETPGEDPYLTGEYAEWYTKGMQENPDVPGMLQASACCKHYVANSMDQTTQADGEDHNRQEVDTVVSMQDLVDSYMYPFQSCVEKGKVSSLMCSYNSVNGVPSCANSWLLKTVAREEWGFEGYITSDCDADGNVLNPHQYLNQTAEEDVASILAAGTDVDCGSFVGNTAASALAKGTITEADVDERLVKLWKVRMRLGHFAQPNPLDAVKYSEICSQESIEASFDGARQAATLVKNTGNTLPLKNAAGSFAVIGPNAELSRSDSGYYGPRSACGGKYWTLVDAVSKFATGAVNSTAGVPDVLSEDTSGIAAAAKLAASVDTVILGVGTDLSWSREGHDARNISFTDAQALLIKEVAAAAKNPVIVVTLTATPLDLTDVLANPKVGAVLHVGQPSVAVMGIAEVLYGKVSPAGRTIQTVYPASYQDQISIFDFGMRPGPSPFVRPDCQTKCPNFHGGPWNPMMHGGPCGNCAMGTNPGRTHRFYTGKPVIPFGFGLSYTSFKYDVSRSVGSGRISLAAVHDMLAETKRANRTFPSLELLAAADPLVSYSVKVTNTGSMDADDVVLGFMTPPGAGTNGVPLQTLYGFDRVHVKAGQTVTVELYPSLADFTQVDAEGVRKALPGTYTFKFGLKESSDHGMGYAEHSIETY